MAIAATPILATPSGRSIVDAAMHDVAGAQALIDCATESYVLPEHVLELVQDRMRAAAQARRRADQLPWDPAVPARDLIRVAAARAIGAFFSPTSHRVLLELRAYLESGALGRFDQFSGHDSGDNPSAVVSAIVARYFGPFVPIVDETFTDRDFGSYTGSIVKLWAQALNAELTVTALRELVDAALAREDGP
jgi:hypothetical protein